MRQAREIGRKNNELSKTRFARDEAEKADLKAKIERLEGQVTELLSELDKLKAGAQETQTSASAKEQELTQEVETLRVQKSELEAKVQAGVNAAPAIDQARLTELEAELVSY